VVGSENSYRKGRGTSLADEIAKGLRKPGKRGGWSSRGTRTRIPGVGPNQCDGKRNLTSNIGGRDTVTETQERGRGGEKIRTASREEVCGPGGKKQET